MEEDVHKGHRIRVKEQFYQVGAEDMEAHQFLELLLFFAVPRQDTNPTAHRLLDAFGDLSNVLEASPKELMQVKGVSRHTASFLSFCGALIRRFRRDEFAEVPQLQTGAEIVSYLRERYYVPGEERRLLLCLNAQGMVLDCLTLDDDVAEEGTDYQDVVRQVMFRHTNVVVLARCTSTEQLQLSSDDVELTRLMIQTFRMLKISMIDFFLLSEKGYASLRSDVRIAPFFTGEKRTVVPEKPL